MSTSIRPNNNTSKKRIRLEDFVDLSRCESEDESEGGEGMERILTSMISAYHPTELDLIRNEMHRPQLYMLDKFNKFDREYCKELFQQSYSPEGDHGSSCFEYMSKFIIGIIGLNGAKSMTIIYISWTTTPCSTQQLPMFTPLLIKQPYTGALQSFVDLVVNVHVPAPTPKNPTKVKLQKFKIFEEYIHSQHFPKFDHACFDASQILGIPDRHFGHAFNMFCGLPINPRTIHTIYNAYKIPLDYQYLTNPNLGVLLHHIKHTLCDDNDAIYEYLLNWLAYIVQNQGKKTGVMIVFIGPSGCGKSTFYSWLHPIFGQYFENIKTADLGAQFSGTSFNEKFLIAIDEWNIKELDPKMADGLLKNIVTDPTMRVEAKYVQAYTATSHNNLMASTNFTFGIAPSSVGYFRRLLTIKCGSTKPPQYYKEMHHLIGTSSQNDNRFALNMHFWGKMLYERNVQDFKPSHFPITDYQIKILANTWKPFMKWWYIVLQRGYILNPEQMDIYRHSSKYDIQLNSTAIERNLNKKCVQFYPENIPFVHSRVMRLDHFGIPKSIIYDAFAEDMKDLLNLDVKRTSYSITHFFNEMAGFLPTISYDLQGRENMVIFPPYSQCIKIFYSQHFAAGLKISSNPFKIHLGKDQEHQSILDEIEKELCEPCALPKDTLLLD